MRPMNKHTLLFLNVNHLWQKKNNRVHTDTQKKTFKNMFIKE